MAQTKYREQRDQAAPVPSVDRLSCFPDEVICHILSFLQTKHSVKSSVLSKRWRFLWADVPVLEFHSDDTANSEIITKIVLQNQHDIHTFRFNINRFSDCSDKEFESWIVNIISRNICNLVICLNYEFLLPQCLFTCKTLVDLFISYCGDIPTSGIYFPALKKLELVTVGYESHESLAHLISGCPVLEELIIYDELNPDLDNLNLYCISSPTLTRLVVCLSPNDGFLDFGLKIDTPALRYLELWCLISDNISVGALDSLIEADISFWLDTDHQDNFLYWSNVSAFASKLYNVKFLKLTTDEAAEIHDFPFPAMTNKFHNLVILNIHLCLFSNLGFITSFLENVNNLQAICLEIEHMIISCLDLDGIDNEYGWMEPERVPAWLISNLQTAVCHFGCSTNEFDMVRYILMNAKVLKKMEIRTLLPKHDSEKKLEALKRLALFERGSQECQLVFD